MYLLVYTATEETECSIFHRMLEFQGNKQYFDMSRLQSTRVNWYSMLDSMFNNEVIGGFCRQFETGMKTKLDQNSIPERGYDQITDRAHYRASDCRKPALENHPIYVSGRAMTGKLTPADRTAIVGVKTDNED